MKSSEIGLAVSMSPVPTIRPAQSYTPTPKFVDDGILLGKMRCPSCGNNMGQWVEGGGIYVCMRKRRMLVAAISLMQCDTCDHIFTPVHPQANKTVVTSSHTPS